MNGTGDKRGYKRSVLQPLSIQLPAAQQTGHKNKIKQKEEKKKKNRARRNLNIYTLSINIVISSPVPVVIIHPLCGFQVGPSPLVLKKDRDGKTEY